MKIGLASDFRDFYDHWFDSYPHDLVFTRMANTGKRISKRQQFAILEKAGFAVPLHGLVKDVWEKTANEYLVLYEDEFAHCGEGKNRWHKVTAAEQEPDTYCSVFIPTTDEPTMRAESRRLLAIGDRMWWLKYKSVSSWMSNHAPEVEISVIGETLNRRSYALEGEHDFSELDQYPLFAIDFVEPLSRRQLLAIDFNTAPGLKGTGMENLISGSEVVKLIREFAILKGLTHDPASV